MANAKIVYIGETHEINLTGLSYTNNAGATVYVNDATVTWSLTDKAGTAITGGSGTLSYLSSTNGNYQDTLSATVTSLLTEGRRYYLIVPITSTNPVGKGYRRDELHAQYRT